VRSRPSAGFFSTPASNKCSSVLFYVQIPIYVNTISYSQISRCSQPFCHSHYFVNMVLSVQSNHDTSRCSIVLFLFFGVDKSPESACKWCRYKTERKTKMENEFACVRSRRTLIKVQNMNSIKEKSRRSRRMLGNPGYRRSQIASRHT